MTEDQFLALKVGDSLRSPGGKMVKVLDIVRSQLTGQNGVIVLERSRKSACGNFTRVSYWLSDLWGWEVVNERKEKVVA